MIRSTARPTTGSCRENDGVSRLCSLLYRHHHPFTESKAEKELLVILSQILGQIRRWIDDDEDDDEYQQQCSRCSCFDSVSEEHDCLADVVSILISSLNAGSKYSQHLASKILLVISEFLLASGEGDNWDKFFRLLCASFEFGLRNVLHPSFNGVENLKSIPANLSAVLHDFTWTGVAGIVGVLRGILKHLKGEDDVELVGIVVDSLSASLLNVPWDDLNGVKENSHTDVKASSGDRNTEVKILLVGNFVQLLCSLVGLVGSTEAGFLDKNAILHKICDLVPKIAHRCLDKEQSFIHGSILAYFQHKILMLMIRLSFHMQLDSSVLLLWLQLLHEHFQDLLSQPLFEVQCGQDDSLEGSPFLVSLYDQDSRDLSSRHLQRQTVFLFVRCCFGLIAAINSTELTVAGKRTNSLYDHHLNTTDDYFARKKGILDLYGWLQDKVPRDIVSENQMYLEKCVKFISSVIRLYIHEDDMLFEALLQMLSLASYPERMYSKDEISSSDTEDDILLYVFVLFNPLLVLHVFLAELQYDHQLLLDYLISKDTGSKCAEYLLRCLRIICDSWNVFTQLLDKETCFCQSNCKKSFKRAKTILKDSSAKEVANPVDCSHTVTLKQYKKLYQPGNKNFGICSIRVQDIKACLLSLKSTLKNLQKKNLFPYNPEVLIRRITRFEVLCDQHV